ncbi:hypothetical protein IC575_013916 [Cucumis melo]
MMRSYPPPPLSSFNRLLGGLAKINHYSQLFSLYNKMHLAGLSPDIFTLNILVNCLCKVNRVSEALAAMVGILRRGYIPNIVIYTTLIKGLCMEHRISEATRLFIKMQKLGCTLDVVTYGTLIKGLCQPGILTLLLSCIKKCSMTLVIMGLIVGREEEAKGLFEEMKAQGMIPNVISYSSLIHGFCWAGKWEESKRLFDD